MPRRLLLVSASFLVLVLGGTPTMASDPESSDVTAPAEIGATATAMWTGTVPPGGEQGGQCTDGPIADGHTLELAVPDGLYDRLAVRGLVEITYDGPATDLIVTVVQPDGTTTNADGGFVDTDESLPLNDPAPGTYRVLVCAFASAVPQSYTGTLTLTAVDDAPQFATAAPCTAPDQRLEFEEGYIDETRAGGEPIVTTHPDGTLLWGSHAGTTHFFGPAAPDPTTAAFLQNYEGQTYQYFSEDDGETWQFARRTPIGGDPTAGAPGSGFSDPEFAIDDAGNVFISEINLANVAISKSTDAGRSYTLQNFFGLTGSDRQWMEADTEDVLYITANGFGGGSFPTDPVGQLSHFIAKSTDGGVSFTATENPNPNGVADLQIDPRTGTLYEISASGDGTLSMAAFRDIRDRDADFADGMEISTIATGVGYSPIGRLIDPTFDMDSEGNLYIVWSENGTGVRPAGLYYSYSTDEARTWALPVRVDPDERTEIWPWIAVGEPGQVAITYLATEAVLENNNAELAAPEDGWNVVVGQSQNGLGCGESEVPGLRLTQASAEPVHQGTICQGGTVCQAEAVDRRLGDYFAIEVDGDGDAYVAVPDTRQGGSVSLPYNIRQVGGAKFVAPPEVPGGPSEAPSEVPSEAPSEVPGATDVRRVGGAGRIATAIALSRDAFADGADAAVLARADDFPDALAASGLTAELDAPLLLNPTDALDGDVAAELRRLDVSTVYLMGGPSALSEAVAEEAAELGVDVVRVGGAERFETAALVAREMVRLGGPIDQAVVSLGGGRTSTEDWPDALAASNLAGAGRAPILLVGPDEVPASTSEALADLLPDASPVFVTGGPDAVGEGPEAALRGEGHAVQRLAGADRYGTAVAVLEEAVRQGADPEPAVLASGLLFADPLVAGPAAQQLGGALLLVDPSSLDASAPTRDYLRANAEAISSLVIAGGPEQVSSGVVDEASAVVADG